MNKSIPIVSVVVPLFNKGGAIESTLRSILNQDVPVPIEVVVVDDGSTDASGDIVRALQLEDERIVYLFKENGGVSSARNTGARVARGEWLIFLDGDDIMLYGGIEKLFRLATSSEDINFACANFLNKAKNGEETLALPLMKTQCLSNGFKAWVFGRAFPCQGTFILRRALALRFPYDESLSRYEDAKMLFDIFRSQEKIMTSASPVMMYRHEFCGLSHAGNSARDFLGQLDFEQKSFWEKVALGGLLDSAVRTYGKDMRKHYLKYLRWRSISHVFSLFARARSFLWRRANLIAGRVLASVSRLPGGIFFLDKIRVFRINWKGRKQNVHLHWTSRIGKGSVFGGANRIGTGVYFKGEIGFGSYIGKDSSISAKIGRFTSIASECRTIVGRHAYTYPFATTSPLFFSTELQVGQTFSKEQKIDEFGFAIPEKRIAVVIGNDCWLGEGVRIISGVKIGDGAVCLAGSIVTKDVPPYAIVGGVPARILKFRYSQEDIVFLKNLKWWNFSKVELEKNADFLCDIETLKTKFQ